MATLLLSRAAARQREIAVRLSLGAGRIRLIRMLLTESLLLAAIAGAFSAYLVCRVPQPLYHLVAAHPIDFPLQPDWLTFSYIAGIVLFTGILSGMAPALESVKVDLTASLKGTGGILMGTMRGARMRGLLVSAQVALSMVLLVEAALFAKSEDRTLRADPGYKPQRVVVSPLRFAESTTAASAEARLNRIADRMRAIPGVRGVAFSDAIPMFGHDTVELRPPLRQDVSQPVDIFTVSPGFFETLGVPLLRGRDFRDSDVSAVVVSQGLANAFWRREDPIGSTLKLPDGAIPVVGVAKNVEPLRFGGSDNPVAYRLRRVDPVRNVMSVRFDAGATSGAAAVRSALRESEPDLIVFARLMQHWIELMTADLWNVVSLIVILGVIATLLATSGIYGAVSFAVNQRGKDLAIRVALGAQRRDVVLEILRAGGRPVLEGLLAGMWLSVATAATLRQGLQDSPLRVDISDPLLYGGAAFLLAAAALAAMLGPARKGSKADPLTALRFE